MVSCSVLTVNIGGVLAKTEESVGNLRLKIYLCHIIHLFSYQYAMKKYLLLIFVTNGWKSSIKCLQASENVL